MIKTLIKSYELGNYTLTLSKEEDALVMDTVYVVEEHNFRRIFHDSKEANSYFDSCINVQS